MKRLFNLLLLAILLAPLGIFAQTTALSEDFSGDFPPTGWTTIHVSGNQSWTKLNDAAFVQYDGGGANNYLITPQIEVKANTIISFDYAANYSTYASATTFTVEISETGNTASDFTTVLKNPTEWSSSNTHVEISLSAYAGKNVYIAFHVVDQDGTGVYVDNVEIDPQSCPKPADVAVSTTSSSATLTWTGDGTSYDVEYATSSAFTEATQLSGTSPMDITGLNSNTTYYFRVRNNCGDEQSAWVTVSAKTACGGETALPYKHSFDDNNAIPTCWTKIYASGSNNPHTQALTAIGASTTHTDPNVCYDGSRAWEVKGGNVMVALPPFSDQNQARLEFWYRQNGTTSQKVGGGTAGSAGTFEIGYVTALDSDGSTFTALDTLDEYAGQKTGQMRYVFVDLDAVPDGAYVALKYTMANAQVSWYIDALTVDYMPACDAITGRPTVKTCDDNSATIVWEDVNDNTEWWAYWQKDGEDTWTEEHVYSKELSLTGLTATSTYKVFVKACDDERAAIKDTLIFKTTAVPFEVTDGSVISFSEDAIETHIQTHSSSVNQWIIGSATGLETEDPKSLYLSDDSSSYNHSAAITHAYAVIPLKFDASAQQTITFKYKIPGGATSGSYNGFSAYIIPAGTDIPSEGYPTGGKELFRDKSRISDWTEVTFTTDEFGETTQQLVFYYRKSSTGSTSYYYANPPAAIDSITINTEACANPKNVVASEIKSDEMTITWQQVGTVDYWDVYYKEKDKNEYTKLENSITFTDAPEATITGLTPNTYYNVAVTAYCNGEELGSIDTLEIKTPCVMITADDMPWKEGFENTVAFECWTLTQTSNGASNSNPYPQLLKNSSPYTVFEGTNALEFKTYYAGTEIVALPDFDITYSDYKISFMYRSNLSYAYGGYNLGTMEFGYLTDKNNASTFTKIADLETTGNGASQENWKEYEYEMTNISDDAKNLALRYTQTNYNYAYTSWYFDNFQIVKQSNCKPIVKNSLTANEGDITANSIIVQFEDTNEAHTAWKMYYRQANTEEEFTAIDITEKSYEVTGLSVNTSYEFYVTVVCTDGDVTEESEPSYTTTIRTACGDIEFTGTWTDNFNYFTSNSTNNKPLCWTIIESADNGAQPHVENATGRTGAALEFKSGNNMIAMPFFKDVDLHQTRIKFYQRNNANTSYPARRGQLFVGVIAKDKVNDGDTSAFEAIEEVPYTGDNINNGYTEIYLQEFETTGDVCIAFRYISTYTGTSWYIDDVTLEFLPDCAPVIKKSLALVDNTETSLSISFTDIDDTHTSWRVYYKKNGTDTWDSIDVTSTTPEITNLESNTSYDMYVAVVCGSGDEATVSEPSNVKTFKTACGAVETFETSFETSAGGIDCWTFAKVTNAYNTSFPKHQTNIGSNYCHTGSACIEVRDDTCIIASPRLSNDIESYRFSMYVRTNDWNGAASYSSLVVGVMSNANDETTFEALDTITFATFGNVANQYFFYELDLAGTSTVKGTDNVIAVKHIISEANQNSWYLDDFKAVKAPDCPAPIKSSVAIKDITNNSATVTFKDNDGSHDAWRIYYDDGTTLDSIDVTAQEGNITGLTGGTTYNVYVKTVCNGVVGEDDSTAVVKFSTKGDPITAPFTMTFDGTDNITNFSMTDNNGKNAWIIGAATSNSDNGATDTRSLYISNDGSANAMSTSSSYNTYWFSYAAMNINFEDYPEFELSFDYKIGSGTYTYLSVYLLDADVQVPTLGIPVGDGVQELLSDINNKPSWTEFKTTLNDVANTSKQLLFVWQNSSYTNSNPAAIDNIKMVGNDCAKPSNLTAKTVEDNNATLTWKKNEATAWTVYYVESANASDESAWKQVSATDSVINITNLEATTQYDAYVVAVCGDKTSAKSGTITFTTLARIINVPDGGLLIDFENEDVNNAFVLTATGIDKWIISHNDSVTSVGNALYISDDDNGSWHHKESGYNTLYAYASVPIKFGNLAEYQLSFDCKIPGGYYYGAFGAVYLLPSSIAVPTTGAINDSYRLSDDLYEIADWTTIVSNPIQNVQGETYQLVFYWEGYSPGYNPPLALDNIRVVGNNCAQPMNMAYVPSSLTTSSVDLTWKETGEATSWTLYYNVAPNGQENVVTLTLNDVTIDNSTITYKLDNLYAGTRYKAYVVSNCGTAEQSNKSQTIEFATTGKSVNTFPFVLDFEDEQNRGVFNFKGTSSDKWAIGSADGTLVANPEGGATNGHSLYISGDDGLTHSYTYTNRGYAAASMLVNFGEDAEYTLDFDYMVGGRLNVDYFCVYLVDADFNESSLTSDNNGNYKQYRLLPLQFGVNDWTHKSIKLNNVTNKTKKIVFFKNNSSAYVTGLPAPAVDNIVIVGSSCAKAVTNLASSAQRQYTTIDLSWTDNNNDVTKWKIYYRPQGEFIDTFQVVEVDNTTYSLGSGDEGGLSMGVLYDIKVTAVCAEGGESVPSFIQASTMCEPLGDNGWFETFAVMDYPLNRSLPLCWTRLKTATDTEETTGETCNFPSIITFANIGTNAEAGCMEFRAGASTTATPSFGANTDNMLFTFKAFRASTSTGGNFWFYLASDVYDTTTWEPIMNLKAAGIPAGDNTGNASDPGYEEFQIPLNNVINKGTDKYVIIDYSTTQNSNNYYFDEFRVFVQEPDEFEEVCDNNVEISLEDATDMTLTDGTTIKVSPNETSAKILWTKGGARKWDAKINLNGKWTTTTGEDTTITFNNLIPGTEYTAYVRSYCYDLTEVTNPGTGEVVRVDTTENGKLSAWNSFTFRTDGEAPECPVVTNLDTAEVKEQSVKVEWTSAGADALSYEAVISDRENINEFLVANTNSIVKLQSNATSTNFNKVAGNNLTDNTTYYVFVRAICKYNESDWTMLEVKTKKAYVAPVVTNIAIGGNDILSTSATLRGSVIANDEVLESVGFEFDRGDNNIETFTLTTITGNPSYIVTDLTWKTNYKFRTFAKSAETTFYASTWQSFKTADPIKPTVTTLAANEITEADSNSATLNGKVVKGDEDITLQGFIYRIDGSTDAYDSIKLTTFVEDMSQQVAGLKSNTTYEYYAYVKTPNYSEMGAKQTFKTAGAYGDIVAPIVTTLESENVAITTATIKGSVEKKTEDINKVGFVYYSNLSMSDAKTVEATVEDNFSVTLTDLAESKIYYYYAFAETDHHKVEGERKTFTTLESPATPYTVKTLQPQNVGGQTAVLKGVIEVSGNKLITKRGFMFGKDGENLMERTVMNVDDSLSLAVSSLAYSTQYAYVAFVQTGTAQLGNIVTYWGDTVKFTTGEEPKVYPTDITTLDAQNITESSAEVYGIVKHEGVNVTIDKHGFAYKAEDETDFTEFDALVEGDNISATLTNLKDTTIYTYYAFAKVGDQVFVGEAKTFTTLKKVVVVIDPQVTTGNAVAEATTAKLNATVIKGSETITASGFKYRVKTATDWTNTVAATITNTGAMSVDITNLTAETEYDYVAFVEVEGGKEFMGTVASFTTKSISIVEPTITLNDVVAGVTTAKLSATITKGTEDITKSGFRYRKVGTSAWENEVEAQVPANGGVMTVDIDGLEESTSYEFTAFVQTASGEFTAQTPKSFATGSGLEEVATGMSVTTYPNPTTSDATLSVEGLTMDAKVIVSDVNGKTIINAVLPAGQTTMTITTSELSSGVYYVTVISDGKTMTHKLIKR